ncbi:unnamed protein product [Sympodiomycopsis kandeliae]
MRQRCVSLSATHTTTINRMDQNPERKLRVAIIHPDLGIGGAERLIVDTAVGLQQIGHEVEIFTTYHDPKHCFEPTRDGTLKVHKMGTYIPRAVAGKFHSVFAIAQHLSLVFQLLLALLYFQFPGFLPRSLYNALSGAPPMQPFDIIFMDQQAFGVPWLKILAKTRVVFYCHFPDKEISNSIAKQRAIARGHSGPSVFRYLYRIPLNMVEEGTIDYADKILVNSEFTQQYFLKAFHRLRRAPRVLYPGIDLSTYDSKKISDSVGRMNAEIGSLSLVQKGILELVSSSDRPLVISVNRFEAKKNVELALSAFAGAQKELASRGKSTKYRLILAGGYDRRVQDNISTLDELEKQATSLGLQHTTLFFTPPPHEPPASMPREAELAQASVIFLPSLPSPLLNTLLTNPAIQALLYTPTEEHFGIVPLEAMACGIPILATNTGGPKESIVDAGFDLESGKLTNTNGTGLLRHPSTSVWIAALTTLLSITETERSRISRASTQRVQEKFSREAMCKDIANVLFEAESKGPVKNEEGLLQWASSIGVFFLMMTAYVVVCRGLQLPK